jgi:hypothetical protein
MASLLMFRCVSSDDLDANAWYAQCVYLEAAVLAQVLFVVSGAICGWRLCEAIDDCECRYEMNFEMDRWPFWFASLVQTFLC